MRIVLLIMTLFLYLFGNSLDVTLKDIYKYKFEDYYFFDVNKSHTKDFSKKKNLTIFEIEGNFNDMIGVNYKYYNNIKNPDDLKEYEIYLGTKALKFFSFTKIKQNMEYDNEEMNFTVSETKYKVLPNTLSVEHNINKYVFYNILEIYKDYISIKELEDINETKPDKNVYRNYR